MKAELLRHIDLLAYKIDSGHEFGHRMLDLQTRVHLQEIKLACLIGDEEFNGAGARVVNSTSDLHCRLAHALAKLLVIDREGHFSMTFW